MPGVVLPQPGCGGVDFVLDDFPVNGCVDQAMVLVRAGDIRPGCGVSWAPGEFAKIAQRNDRAAFTTSANTCKCSGAGLPASKPASASILSVVSDDLFAWLRRTFELNPAFDSGSHTTSYTDGGKPPRTTQLFLQVDSASRSRFAGFATEIG